ncbi:MAP3K12-binding inhibitory protein 1 isoform X1 [Scleropages formosus]|uniref:MAP3K12 binding inhibitory protein 1 n=1 Tax=Scleropages formosus TaxID=113540 RepID=A0A8C9V8A8_SCLFO|nr:MAP3K12-binding inhibitory protein 1 isoform X1 [Scleropages formosus]
MAEKRGSVREDPGGSDQQGNGAAAPRGERASAVTQCVCELLNCLSAFSAELNLGADVLKISTNPDLVDVSSIEAESLFGCVQKHISQLEAVSASLRQLSKPDTMVSLGGDVTPAKGQASEGTVNTETVSVRCPLTERNIPDPEAKSKADELNVQIRASKSEIDRRISAFIERKQLEINENNVREFCNVIDCNQENSCARTDAVFTPFPGFKSHVKVTRVVNTYGPQTRSGASGEMKDQKRGVAPRDCGNPAVEERLHNIELHLKLPAEGPVPLSIYQRLKRLEDRILELEGLSPEYFQAMTYLHKRPKMANSQEYSLSELDGKISALKATLLKKVGQLRPRNTEDFTLQ